MSPGGSVANAAALGLGVAAASAAAVYTASSSGLLERVRSTSVTVLVFKDVGGGDNGLDPVAAFIKSDASFNMDQLKKASASSLGCEVEGLRLWVQATKEEVTSAKLKSVLGSPLEGLSAVVLVATQDGSALSSAASGSAPLQRFRAGPTPLPVVGNALGMKNGPHEVPIWNGYHNFFEKQTITDGYEYSKTVRVKLPLKDEGKTQSMIYGIDYNPIDLEGVIMTVDCRLVEELLARQEDFPKVWSTENQNKINSFVDPGLFSESTTSDTWQTGHGVLPRFFNAIRIKNYFPIVLQKTQGFINQWAKLGDGAMIEEMNDWLTCLAADAVTKACMDFDMRNIERKGANEDLHPFIEAFRFGLGYAVGGITPEMCFSRMQLLNPLFDTKGAMDAKAAEARATCQKIISEVVEDTRSGKIGGPLSFVTGMLESKSSTNGKHVGFSNFYGHLMNIMIAGHETTAAALGHCLGELSNNPECLAKAVAEIEAVMGDRVSPTYEDIGKLPYIEACFKETLRLYPSVTVLIRDVAQDTVVQDKYLLRKGQRIMINNYGVHRDPDQWDQQGLFGDTNSFNPDRHLPGLANRHPNAFMAFGIGVRGCIGSQFALLEAKTFLCMVLNFFSVELPSGFKLQPSSKEGGAAPCPKDLRMILRYRKGGPLSRISLFDQPPSKPITDGTAASQPEAAASSGKGGQGDVGASGKQHNTPLLVCYGSNSGTCVDFASMVVSRASQAGFAAETCPLDVALKKDHESLPLKNGAFVIVTSTYNGQPPENASKFGKWLSGAKEGSVTGMQYAVFGVGNSNWEATYQQFPKAVHNGLARIGATQLMDMSSADANNPSFADDFEDWMEQLMITLAVNFGLSNNAGAAAATASNTKPSYVRMTDQVPFKGEVISSSPAVHKEVHARLSAAHEDFDVFKQKMNFHSACKVTKSTQLQSEESDRSTCELEIQLPADGSMAYTAGEHLEVKATNSRELVDAALAVLGLSGDTVVDIFPIRLMTKNNDLTTEEFEKSQTSLQQPITVPARLALETLPDLAAPPSRKTLLRLAEDCPCPPEAAALRALAEAEAHAAKVTGTSMTLAEVLEMYKSVNLDIGQFCSELPRLSTRYYSISSSPLVKKDRLTITVGLVDYTTKTGRHHRGASSGQVHSVPVGGVIMARIRQLSSNFKLPADPKTPVVMIGPGTGVAPFMGFLEERDALLNKEGTELGPAHLFFGCRSSNTDYIYRNLLVSYTKSGVLSSDGLHIAFSREEAHAKMYVQDLVAEEGAKLWELLEAGAFIYICGDARRMAPDVKRAFCGLACEHGGMNASHAENWMGSLIEGGRYLEDVWAG